MDKANCNLPCDPKGIAHLCLRVSFGLSLALVGAAHYMNFDMFMGMVASNMGILEVLAAFGAFAIPALQLGGGLLLAAGLKPVAATWMVGISLGAIAVGMLAKPVFGGADLGAVMPMAQNALIWYVVFVMVGLTGCCGSSCKGEGGEHHG